MSFKFEISDSLKDGAQTLSFIAEPDGIEKVDGFMTAFEKVALSYIDKMSGSKSYSTSSGSGTELSGGSSSGSGTELSGGSSSGSGTELSGG